MQRRLARSKQLVFCGECGLEESWARQNELARSCLLGFDGRHATGAAPAQRKQAAACRAPNSTALHAAFAQARARARLCRQLDVPCARENGCGARLPLLNGAAGELQLRAGTGAEGAPLLSSARALACFKRARPSGGPHWRPRAPLAALHAVQCGAGWGKQSVFNADATTRAQPHAPTISTASRFDPRRVQLCPCM